MGSEMCIRDRYNNSYFKALSSYLNIKWPNNLKEISATVGLIPVFPRYLDNFSFSIGTGVDDSKLLEVCAHETLHFLWFEKWKQIHPETPRREYDSPYLVWQYSEMVTDPILNNKPFSTMFEFDERGYDSCLLYTSDAADEEDSIYLGWLRITKKKKKNKQSNSRRLKKL